MPAGHGHTNLPPVQRKRSLDPGDSKEMAAGHYEPIADAVARADPDRRCPPRAFRARCRLIALALPGGLSDLSRQDHQNWGGNGWKQEILRIPPCFYWVPAWSIAFHACSSDASIPGVFSPGRLANKATTSRLSKSIYRLVPCVPIRATRFNAPPRCTKP